MAEPATLDSLARLAAARFGDRLAVRAGHDEMTFGDLDERVDRFAAALQGTVGTSAVRIGVAAVLAPIFPVLFYGTARSGNQVVLINPMMRGSALEHVFRTAGIRIACVPAAVARHLVTVRDDLPDLETIYVLDGPGPDGTRPIADLVGLAGSAVPEPVVRQPDDVVCVQFTSGTTGPPKGVLLTHRNLVVNAGQAAEALDLDADSVCLNHLPLYHLMHLNAAVRAGAAQELCRDEDPVGALAASVRAGATHLFSLPVRLARLAADERLAGISPGPRLRVVASGGSALGPAVAQRLGAALGVPIIQGYGLAELSPLSHNDRGLANRPGSVGLPVRDTECRIVALDTGKDVPPGEPGEVLLRGPQLMAGYLGVTDPAEIDADGWFHTGDVGHQDADGRLFLVDRIKDVFKVDNELVSPSEIERVLAQLPGVADCVVADRPDEFSGAQVWAGVVPADDADLGRIVDAANDRLSAHERIRSFEWLSTVPRSPNGKVDRKAVRARLHGATTTR